MVKELCNKKILKGVGFMSLMEKNKDNQNSYQISMKKQQEKERKIAILSGNIEPINIGFSISPNPYLTTLSFCLYKTSKLTSYFNQ